MDLHYLGLDLSTVIPTFPDHGDNVLSRPIDDTQNLPVLLSNQRANSLLVLFLG